MAAEGEEDLRGGARARANGDIDSRETLGRRRAISGRWEAPSLSISGMKAPLGDGGLEAA